MTAGPPEGRGRPTANGRTSTGPPRPGCPPAAAGSRGPSHQAQAVTNQSPITAVSPSTSAPRSRASASQAVAFSPASSRWSRSWLPEQTTVAVCSAQPGHVLQYDGDLGVQGHARRDVQQIPRDDQEVDVDGLLQDPVELAQVVVQIGDEQGAHGGSVASPSTVPLVSGHTTRWLRTGRCTVELPRCGREHHEHSATRLGRLGGGHHNGCGRAGDDRGLRRRRGARRHPTTGGMHRRQSGDRRGRLQLHGGAGAVASAPRHLRLLPFRAGRRRTDHPGDQHSPAAERLWPHRPDW